MLLTSFDDYPIHQMPVPVAQTGTSDRNHYDRYFFNGYLPDGEVFFGGAMGLYPNRQVIDAAFSIVHDGRQKNLHVSGRAPLDRATTEIGPIRVEVIEPMKRIRMIVLQSGPAKLAQWVAQRRNLVADYLRMFADEADGRIPEVVGLAISADADNTHGHGLAYFGDVTLTP